MKTFPSAVLQIELLKEEQAYLFFLRDRHSRWSRDSEDVEIRNTHWETTRILKELIEVNDKILEALEMHAD